LNEIILIDIVKHQNMKKEGTPIMNRLKSLLQYMRVITSIWSRVLVLIWKTNPWHVTWLLIFTFLGGLIPSLQIQVTSQIVQNAAEAIQQGSPTQLVHLAIFFGFLQGGLMVLSSLLGIGQQQIQSLLQTKLANTIAIQIMEKAIELDVQYFEDHEFYDKLQRANRESSYRPYQIFWQMVTIGSQCVTLVSVVIVLLSWNWWLGLLILFAPLPSVVSQIFYGQQSYKIERERTQQYRRLSYFQYLTTNAHSVKEIRLFRLGDLFLGRYKQLYNGFYKVDSDLVKRETRAIVPFSVLTNVVSAGAQIYAISFTIASGHIGLLAGYMQAIAVVQHTLESLLWGVSQLYQNNLFVNNLFEFLDVPAQNIVNGKRPVPERLESGIEFRGVSFCYPGTTEMVLQDLNLFLKAGECVALVGHNGAGKTTLVKLLTRLYEPTSGNILLDGVPLEEYDIQDVRRHISVIFQDFVHYEMAVRENVGFGYVEELDNDERIHLATSQSGAASFIEDLSQKYETTLGRMFEKGQELSIGQWQKMALARAFMRRAPVVVLDEPTSSIDAESESEIFGQLQHIAAGATTLLIAHRFSTVRMADRIIVIKQGKIIEDGTHEALMAIDGTYAHLFRLQAAGYLIS
jgi:ATP-binding cassette, subfamily B, bacterial